MNELNQQQFVEEEGMTLQELFKIVWLNKFTIAFITLWVAVIGIVYTFVVIQPEYTAETSLMVSIDYEAAGITESSAISIGQNLINTYKEFVISDKVLQSVIDDIDGLPAGFSTKSLENQITISTTSGVLLIYISVENENPELAQEIANTLVNNSIEIANDDEVGYILLQNKLDVLDTAKLPTEPSSPNKFLNIVISVLLGGIVSLGYVFVKELFNNKYQSSAEMEKHLGIKVIAAVPGTIKERKVVE